MSKVFKKHKGLDTAMFYAALIIGAVAGLIVFLTNADTTPATYADYQPLYEQVEALKSDFSLIGDMDNIAATYPEKGKIVLDGGKECDLVVYYNTATNEITSTVEIDKVLTSQQYFAYLGLMVVAGGVIACLIVAAVFVVMIIAEKIKQKPKKEYY